MRKLMICALALVAVGCMSATAFARGVKASSEIQKGNAFCGGNDGLPKAGTAKLVRTVNSVKVSYKLTAGDANEKYVLELWNSSPCEEIGVVSEFTTNAKGKGVGSGTITVPQADSEFFATGLDRNGFSDALTVSLP
jgi:hypothetical protein